MSFGLNTTRLSLKELDVGDVSFIYQLFTDPDCLRFIGDRDINSLDDAESYLIDKLIHSYRTHGFGLYKVTLQNDDVPMGICGLVKRDKSNPPDIGFAFLPAFRNQGYCTEASQAILDWAKLNNISQTIMAYTSPENAASIQVLEKIGLKKQHITTLPGQDFESLVMMVDFN